MENYRQMRCSYSFHHNHLSSQQHTTTTPPVVMLDKNNNKDFCSLFHEFHHHKTIFPICYVRTKEHYFHGKKPFRWLCRAVLTSNLLLKKIFPLKCALNLHKVNMWHDKHISLSAGENEQSTYGVLHFLLRACYNVLTDWLCFLLTFFQRLLSNILSM